MNYAVMQSQKISFGFRQLKILCISENFCHVEFGSPVVEYSSVKGEMEKGFDGKAGSRATFSNFQQRVVNTLDYFMTN